MVFLDLMFYLSFVEYIVVCGSSVGGIGVLNYVKWFLSFFFVIFSVKLLFIIDLVWFINF